MEQCDCWYHMQNNIFCSLIVNYAARAFGVSRHASLEDCFKKCPELRLVHVATFSVDAARPGAIRYYPATIGEAAVIRPDQTRHKSCLDPYRRAGAQILRIFQRLPGVVVEKASVDEAYLDVTALVEERYEAMLEEEKNINDATNEEDDQVDCASDIKEESMEGFEDVDWSQSGHPAVSRISVNNSSKDDIFIWIGTRIAQELRRAVFEELGYTVSVGIAPNKMLAKLASAAHKPDSQTFVTTSMIGPWIRETPLRKLRLFGGKFGEQLLTGGSGRKRNREDPNDEDDEDHNDDVDSDDESMEFKDLNTIKAGDLWPLSKEQLASRIQSRVDDPMIDWVYDAIRGHTSDRVTSRTSTQTFLSAKSFSRGNRLDEWDQVHRWVAVLVAELHGRLSSSGDDRVESKEGSDLDWRFTCPWPRSLFFSYRSPSTGGTTRTRTSDFPYSRRQGLDCDRLVGHLMNLLIAENGKEKRPLVLPCWFLGIGLCKFDDLGDSGGRNMSMEKYLTLVDGSHDLFAKFSASLQSSSHDIDVRPKAKAAIVGGLDKFIKPGRLMDDPTLQHTNFTKTEKVQSRKRKVTNTILDNYIHVKRPQEGSMWSCSECSKTLEVSLLEAIQEHADYHLALRLSKEMK